MKYSIPVPKVEYQVLNKHHVVKCHNVGQSAGDFTILRCTNRVKYIWL